ncbi:Protein mlp1 [Coniosporium tulheliwenetii]|uniref:Protein mlp1 n=1 Tax=Coniosporium tulheliwenetii TaxID=3383036 RepID=A0ACC2YIL5_9PEZI|nr:Protein mlp1 [Cladosporium sp. JES 115]
MATAAIDIPYIAASYAVPEPTLRTLLDAPTVELVSSLLEKIEAKAREFDIVKAEKLRSDVELENAVRTGDARARALKASDYRRKLNEEENARASIESELQTLKSSSTSSTSEVDALRSRINSLESSNRDTLSLLEAKSTAYDKLAEELAAQHQKITNLRREVSELEQKNQAAENASMSTKFREQALQQEVDLLKKNNEWHETELQTRGQEYTKYRKEKGARIAELQRLNEDANQTIESLQRTENSLRNRLEEVNAKAEDAFARIQQLQEAAAKSEESFRVELDSSQRLADLQKQSADTARARLQDVQAQLDQIKEDAAEELGRMQAEVETERSEKDRAEQRVMELELQVETLEASVSAAQRPGSIPSTPRRGINGLGNMGTPARLSSPGVFTPGASRMKGSLSFTQLYSEHSQMKTELEAERRRNEKLSSTIESMLQDLEAKQPEIEEMRVNHDILNSQVTEYIALLEERNQEMDNLRREARRWEGQVEGLAREGDILRQQLRDLSAQIKILLIEIQARDGGLEALSAADQAQLERVVRGEIEEAAVEGMSDTARFITQRLTIFRNIQELQEQNMKLLRVTRELGEQMEGEEARRRRNQDEEDRQELAALRERVARHQDEMRAMNTQAESYIRERDMFRRMLAHRGQIPSGADATAMFGQSIDGRTSTNATPPPGANGPGTEQSSSAKELADYAKLVKEMQSHFDAYRKESATDQAALKQQLDRLAKEKSELQNEMVRASSQLTLAHERYELLQANLNMFKDENSQLQKQKQSYAETAARQDLRTQQVAEELVEAKGLADSMRNEMANLKAERELWKKIEARLAEDNRVLMDERSRLNKMISDLQNLQNERELSESENRRRLQTRADNLESELQSLRRKLDDEVEENKKTALRREYDQEQSRTRIDDLVKSLSNTKEELAAAKTHRDELQARIDEMKADLRNAEERAQALQPRPTPRVNGTSADAAASADNENEALSREQELGVEVADLRRDLELARAELEVAKGDIEQYKSISQSSEDALENLQQASDQYREEMDSIVAEKDARVRELEQRVEDISAELNTTNNQLNELRREQEESTMKLNEQKTAFESEITRLKDDNERHAEAAKLYQEDLKAQAGIAQQAQQSYETELVRHAEAAKSLQKVRAEYNQLRTEVAEIKAEAQASKASLAQSEESWAETRNRYERELEELKSRREDVNAQNRILHQQLENVSSQIAALKQNRASTPADGEAAASPSSGVDNLQEVIRYLRREKEIVDVQYELSIQEAKRLKQQLDHTQAQLDQTREKLNQERQNQATKEQDAMSHSKLMQTINELNLFRESSTTLRNEARQAQAQLAERTKEVEDLLAQVQPLQTRTRELENELEIKDGELNLLQQDRDRWQQRTQDIISKYNRVDPAEIESYKTQIEELTSERDRLVSEKQPMQEQIDGIPEQIRRTREEMQDTFSKSKEKLVEQFKARSRELSAKIRDSNSENQRVTGERDQLTQELNAVRAELEETKAARDEALANAKSADAAMENGIEEGQVDEGLGGTLTMSTEEKAALEARISAAEAKANEESARAAALQREVEALQGRIRELEGQVTELQQQLETSSADLALLRSQMPLSNSIPDAESAETLERLRNDLSTAQQEVETLRANAIVASVQATTDDSKSVADQVTEQVAAIRADLEAKHAERVKELEEQFARRADNMRKQLSTKLTDGRAQYREEIRKEYEERMQNLRTEHEAEIQRLKSEHEEEVQRLKAQAPPATNDAGKGEPVGSIIVEAVAEGSAPGEAPAIKPGTEKSFADWKPSEAEVKHFLATNDTVKEIVRRNIRNKLNEEKEGVARQAKEEQEKVTEERLEEARKQADEARQAAIIDARQQATNLESKRSSLKLGMAEKQRDAAKAKWAVVEQAAKETPQRPVVEVWEIAKDAKPAATNASAPPSSVAPSSSPAPAPAQLHQGSFGRPSGPPAQPAQNQQPPQPDGGFFKPGMTGRPGAPPQAPAASNPSFGQPTPATFQQGPASSSPMHLQSSPAPPTHIQGQSQGAPAPQDMPRTASPVPFPGQQQNQQQQGQGQGQQNQNRGQQPAGTDGDSARRRDFETRWRERGFGQPSQPMQQQGMQPPQQQMQGGQMQQNQNMNQNLNQRGGASGLPRGGGRGRGGRGRGGGGEQNQNQMVQMQMPQEHGGQGSPRGGMNLNPGARQFVPGGGNKRPHEGVGTMGVGGRGLGVVEVEVGIRGRVERGIWRHHFICGSLLCIAGVWEVA